MNINDRSEAIVWFTVTCGILKLQMRCFASFFFFIDEKGAQFMMFCQRDIGCVFFISDSLLYSPLGLYYEI